jgi:nicotinate-nucleotide adenylyltransferase
MVKEAIDDNRKLKASDIEFKLKKPNYTVNTLTHLIEKYPSNNFSLIMGEDNLRGFHKWFNHEQIIEKHKIFVYPRLLTIQESLASEGSTVKHRFSEHPNVTFCKDAPVMKVSSSFIRTAIKERKEVRYLLSEPVFNYVEEMKFYQ